ncbi:Hypothetical predicted protein [Pelobates cultripes]|uniref:Uncharacterized protein n=1 Tax=Pelobates cultripes TaxID=61616 RepID=A0AAD1RC35_PELCU|nr:Hypothetical predicted protein [Pelobates cultripes]
MAARPRPQAVKDIARLLQEREEKRRKNYYPSSPTRDEANHTNHEGHRKGRHKEYRAEHDRHHRHDRPEQERMERSKKNSEHSSSNIEVRSRGRSVELRPNGKPEDDYANHRPENHHHKSSKKKDRPERPPPPKNNKNEDVGNDKTNGELLDEHLSRRGRSQSRDLPNKNDSGSELYQDSSSARDTKSYNEGDYKNERHRRRTPSPKHKRHPGDSGHRQRGTRDTPQTRHTSGPKTREEYDAEIARKLQERELKVNVVDLKAAQMAQDEEIARWLMEKEEKAYKKSKGREKMDKRRPEEREPRSHEHTRLGTRETQELHRSRSDKPYRPLPPSPDEDGEGDYDRDYINRNQHCSPRSNPKSQSSHKSSYYRP